MKTLFTNGVAQLSKIWASLTNRSTTILQEELNINAYSQPHALKCYMSLADLTHDAKVIADIGPIRVEKYEDSPVKAAYFCPMNGIVIKSILQEGDGGSLPSTVVLKGITVPADTKMGLYMLKNVELHSNGVITVSSTKHTVLEEYKDVAPW